MSKGHLFLLPEIFGQKHSFSLNIFYCLLGLISKIVHFGTFIELYLSSYFETNHSLSVVFELEFNMTL